MPYLARAEFAKPFSTPPKQWGSSIMYCSSHKGRSQCRTFTCAPPGPGIFLINYTRTCVSTQTGAVTATCRSFSVINGRTHLNRAPRRFSAVDSSSPKQVMEKIFGIEWVSARVPHFQSLSNCSAAVDEVRLWGQSILRLEGSTWRCDYFV